MMMITKVLRATAVPFLTVALIALASGGSPTALEASTCRPDHSLKCKETEACVGWLFMMTCTTTTQYGTLIGCPTCWVGDDTAEEPSDGPTDPGMN